jgi:hypothetical protein
MEVVVVGDDVRMNFRRSGTWGKKGTGFDLFVGCEPKEAYERTVQLTELLERFQGWALRHEVPAWVAGLPRDTAVVADYNAASQQALYWLLHLARVICWNPEGQPTATCWKT